MRSVAWANGTHWCCGMARNRFFVDKIEDEVLLTGEEFKHARTVLRLSEGSEVTLLDGSGVEYRAIVSQMEKNGMRLHVLEGKPSDTEPQTQVYLLAGALKGDKTELIVQKAVELGVSRIGVFASKYCAAYMNANKLERLNRVAREASKQCMRATVPTVEYFDDFPSALKSADGYENKLFACEFLDKSEAGLSGLNGSTAIVIGSEGGFAEEEFAFAKACNFVGVSLGKRILRAETACIALLSVVMYELGELK